MKVSIEFSNAAQSYSAHNSIQNLVIKKLLSTLKTKPNNILDLGCGSGSLCRAIDWEYKHFTGVDFAPGMLELHPKSKKIECIYGDFNDSTLFDNLVTYKYDHIFSASALQWANSMEEVFVNIQKLNRPISLAIFTSGTFKTLNETASIESMLLPKEKIDVIQQRYFNATFEVVNYKLEFESVREMFKYIKRSGVSGSRNVLSYKQMRKLMSEYPLNYLEFEVAFIYSKIPR